MKKWFLSLSILIGTIFLIFTSYQRTIAESIEVSLRVGDTEVVFSGYTSPLAFVTIKQDSVVIGSTSANAGGNWTKTINTFNLGVQSFDLTATDTSSLITPTITYNVNLPANTTTTLGDIVFPPTITSGTLPTSISETLTLSGMTHPLSTLTIFISDGTTYTVSPSSNGNWNKSFIVSDTAGTYTAYATATMPGNFISLASHSISYTLYSNTSSTAPSTIASASPSLPSPSTLTPVKITNLITKIFTPDLDLSEPATPSSENPLTTIAKSVINLSTILIMITLILVLRVLSRLLSKFKKSSKHK